MQISSAVAALVACAALLCNAQINLTNPDVSRQTLSAVFTPPQVWKNVNLVRTINLEKGYPRETINLVIENAATTPQNEYYLPFGSGVVDKVGSIEARDKKDAAKPPFEAELVEYDCSRYGMSSWLPQTANSYKAQCDTVLPDTLVSTARSI